jgi:small subunit ribosomal protein S20
VITYFFEIWGCVLVGNQPIPAPGGKAPHPAGNVCFGCLVHACGPLVSDSGVKLSSKRANFKNITRELPFFIPFPYLCRPKFSNCMANHQATKKDVRQSTKRRERNKYYGKTTRNAIRDLKEIKTGKEAGEKLVDVISMVDKLAKKGIIHKNKAANLKSKLSKRINTLAK